MIFANRMSQKNTFSGDFVVLVFYFTLFMLFSFDNLSSEVSKYQDLDHTISTKEKLACKRTKIRSNCCQQCRIHDID